jgi:hypothetical protein
VRLGGRSLLDRHVDLDLAHLAAGEISPCPDQKDHGERPDREQLELAERHAPGVLERAIVQPEEPLEHAREDVAI